MRVSGSERTNEKLAHSDSARARASFGSRWSEWEAGRKGAARNGTKRTECHIIAQSQSHSPSIDMKSSAIRCKWVAVKTLRLRCMLSTRHRDQSYHNGLVFLSVHSLVGSAVTPQDETPRRKQTRDPDGRHVFKMPLSFSCVATRCRRLVAKTILCTRFNRWRSHGLQKDVRCR